MDLASDERIAELFGAAAPFADRRIEKYPAQQERNRFVTSSSWSDQASVNLMDVCGTMHADYAGLTWREFLVQGRRMEANIQDFLRNPVYYTELPKRLPSMFFHRFDGRTYVTEDGNHRTCIGKFYLHALGRPYLHNVHLTESVTDWEFFSFYQRAKLLLPSSWALEMVRTLTGREDGPGWKRDLFDLKLRCSVNEGRRRASWLWSKEEAEERLPREWESRRPGLRGFLNRFLPRR